MEWGYSGVYDLVYHGQDSWKLACVIFSVLYHNENLKIYLKVNISEDESMQMI